MSDFHLAYTGRDPGEIGMVIGPAMFEPVRKGRFDWLATVSQIMNFDEGLIWYVAQEIASERL
jgi:hypothetical protein